MTDTIEIVWPAAGSADVVDIVPSAGLTLAAVYAPPSIEFITVGQPGPPGPTGPPGGGRTPEQFATGTDAGDIQAALNDGAALGAVRSVRLQDGKTYNLGSTTIEYDQNKGDVVVDATGATVSYTGTGNAFHCVNSVSGTLGGRMVIRGGTWIGLTAAALFELVDTRRYQFREMSVTAPAGVAFHLLNQDVWCERNQFISIDDLGCRTVVKCEAATFKTTGKNVTITASDNRVSYGVGILHNKGEGDPVKFGSLSGAAGLVNGTIYYVNTVVDDFTFTVTADATVDVPVDVDITTDGTGVSLASGSSSFARTLIRDMFLSSGVPTYCKIDIGDGTAVYSSLISGVRGNIAPGSGILRLAGNMNGTVVENIGVEISANVPVTLTASTDPTAPNQVRFLGLPHGKNSGDAIKFAGLSAGTGLVNNTTYRVRDIMSPYKVTLAAYVGGPVIALTADGTGTASGTGTGFAFRLGTQVAGRANLGGTNNYKSLSEYDSGTPPDPAKRTWNPSVLKGLAVTHSRQSEGLDELGRQATLPATPNNPATMITQSTAGVKPFDAFGNRVDAAKQGRGIYWYDGNSNPLIGIDDGGKLGFYDKALIPIVKPSAGTTAALLTALASLGLITNTAGASGPVIPGQLLALTRYKQTTIQPLAVTPATTSTFADLAAACVTAAWTASSATMFDLTFTAPASGLVDIEFEGLFSSASGATVGSKVCMYDIGAAAVVAASTQILTAGTGQIRGHYTAQFTLTPGTTYTWRPQWASTSGSTAMQVSAGGASGTVRVAAYASI